MVLKIYTEEWHKIVGYLREVIAPLAPPKLGQLVVNARRAEVDGRAEFDPDELGKKTGSFRTARVSTLTAIGFRSRIFARTEADTEHYLTFDLGECPVGERHDLILDSVLGAFWAARNPIRLKWKIGEDFFVDRGTMELFQQPPLRALDLGQPLGIWLRHAVDEAAMFVAAEKQVMEEYCPSARVFSPEGLLPLWKLTRFGHLLDLLGVS